jgi:NTE family protein
MAQIIGHMFNSAFVDSLEGDIEQLERLNRLVALIPEASRKQHGIKVRPIESLVISPSEQLDKIAGRKIRYLPRSLRFFLRNTGATASGGGATAASYLLFAKPFIDDLIALGYKDTMWERDAIETFFAAASKPE